MRTNPTSVTRVQRLLAMLTLLAVVFSGGCMDYALGRKYSRIHKGMKQAEVESILGKGDSVKPDDVATGSYGRGDIRPVVKGQKIYEWTNKQGEQIWIGFTSGQVGEMDYYGPSF